MKMVVDRLRSELDAFEAQTGGARPTKWEEVVEDAAQEVTGSPPIPSAWYQLLDRESVFFAWGPSAKSLTAGLVGRLVMYLCWGMPSKRGGAFFMGIKRLRLSLILRSAKVILANDRVTQNDIRALAGRSAILIPYVVDGAFFEFGQPHERSEFILVPGNNDRDEDLVLAIARTGMKVVRVTAEPRVVAHYRVADTAGIVDVRYRVGYGELRLLYQKARVVALPLRSRNHSAGQTALLEAVAAGAPVVISKGRVWEEVQYLKSVIACKRNQVHEWLKAFDLARDILVNSPNELRNCSMHISTSHSPSSVRKQLVEILRTVCRAQLNCA